MPDTPAFGSANLTNCERELIHLAGSIQPHGVLLVLREPEQVIVQASANVADLTGRPLEDVLGSTLASLGGDADHQVRVAAAGIGSDHPEPLRLSVATRTGLQEMEGALHRNEAGLIVEFEPVVDAAPGQRQSGRTALPRHLSRAIEKLTGLRSEAAVCDAAVQIFRSLTGYDRVMVYKFDPDGHGEVAAEARRPDLESFLGLHYPATDIPQRARELYLRNRVRVLVDVYYTPSPVVPRKSPQSGTDVDQSLCYLRSMSPVHLQYLQNMGVTATLVSSLVRDGKLWGLVACHHYSPKRVAYETRVACELLSEVVSARLATLDRQAQAVVEQSVRRLEQQVIEAVSATGDWRPALFVSPKGLLQLVGATGAALVYDRDIMTAGETPSSPDLFELAAWISRRHGGQVFETQALARADARFAHLTPLAAGVLAISLSERRSDYLIWFRKEQPLTVTWAGDPRKPMTGDDPLHLSPRRSFAVWTEAVRGTARPWTAVETGTAAAFRAALSGIVQQIQAVRVLIAHHQLEGVTRAVEQGWEPIVLGLSSGRVLLANQAFHHLVGGLQAPAATIPDLAACFATPTEAERILTGLVEDRISWNGELTVRRPDGTNVPVALRADVVPAEGGGVMGFVLLVTDLTATKRAEAARRLLDEAIQTAARAGRFAQGLDTQTRRDLTEMMNAILATASEAAHIVGSESLPSLEDVESLTKRAADLTRQMLSHSAASRRRH